MQVIIIISDSRSVQVMKLTSYYWFGSYEPKKKKAFSRLTACLGGFSSVTAVMQKKGGRNYDLAKLYCNNGLM